MVQLRDESTFDYRSNLINCERIFSGLAGEATVTLSYASVGENSKDVLEAVDYIRGPAVVRLSPGQSMANVTVAILPDDDPELKEIFVIRLDR